MTSQVQREKIATFWKRHQHSLQAHYPGLTLLRWQREAQTYCRQNGNNLGHFLESARRGVPLEYISGRAFFYKSELAISPAVFIPRFETEILVEKAVQICRHKWPRGQSIDICDVGTGCGAIILSLCLELPGPVKACAVDLSSEALKLARQNYAQLRQNLPKKTSITFYRGDRLNPLKGKKQHLILSNPPYLKESADRVGVHPQVLQYEPHPALFLEDGAYDSWYREFFRQIFQTLHSGGECLMEGDPQHLPALADLAHQLGFVEVALVSDYNRHKRFLEMARP